MLNSELSRWKAAQVALMDAWKDQQALLIAEAFTRGVRQERQAGLVGARADKITTEATRVAGVVVETARDAATELRDTATEAARKLDAGPEPKAMGAGGYYPEVSSTPPRPFPGTMRGGA